LIGRAPKYRNRKTVVDGVTFDSAKEARRYGELKILQRAGQISGLHLQPSFPIVINGVKTCTYKADFGYINKSGASVVEDVKGFKTPIYNLKKRLMKAVHGIEVLET